MLTPKQVERDTRSYHNRQHALEALKKACVEDHVCPACATSAGLYLAAQAALAIKYEREAFLELAGRIYDDLVRQMNRSVQ
jgi:tryptophan synthase beta subunit